MQLGNCVNPEHLCVCVLCVPLIDNVYSRVKSISVLTRIVYNISVRSGQIRNSSSARISMPGQVIRYC